MNRLTSCVAIAVLSASLIGCGGSRISDQKWKATSVTTEAELTEAFGSGTLTDDQLRNTVITDYGLPEDARVLQWPDPDEDGVYYIAAIVNGKVSQQIKWNSNKK
jgi:hypothetical protein